MRPRPLLILALAAGLLGFGLATHVSPRPARPQGDDPTFTLAALSLWHDHDLAWDGRDLERSFALWSEGPSGLRLRDDPPRFAVSPALPMAAAPWAGVFGVDGIRWLNGLLYLGMMIAAGRLVGRGSGGTVFWVGSFVASVSLLFVTRLAPTILLAACLFLPVAVGLFLSRQPPSPSARPSRWGERSLLVAAGLAAGAALHAAPVLAVLGLALVAVPPAGRRLRAVAIFLASALAGVVLLAGLGARWSGSAWQPAGLTDESVRTYSSSFPGEADATPVPVDADAGLSEAQPEGSRPASYARQPGWLRAAVLRLIGRYRGLLPWAPFTLLALLLSAVARRDPVRSTLLGLTLILAIVEILWRDPLGAMGGSTFIGDCWLAAVCPVLVLLVPEEVFTGRRKKLAAAGLAVALLAAGLWTVPGLAAAAFPGRSQPLAGLAGAPGAFRALPVELPLLPSLPGYARRPAGVATWVLPRGGFSVEEGHAHGVWMLGGTDAEVFVAAPQLLDRIAFTAYSPRPQARLTAASGGDQVLVRFDSENKRAGVPVSLPAVPVGRDLGYFPRASEDFVYRVVLAAEGGWVPARSDPASADGRYLSVFLSFDGEGP